MSTQELESDLTRVEEIRKMVCNIERELFGALRQVDDVEANEQLDYLNDILSALRVDHLDTAVKILMDKIADIEMYQDEYADERGNVTAGLKTTSGFKQ